MGPDALAGATIVAIPVRNEAEEIVFCLQALAAQTGGPPVGVVLCLNNCTDATSTLVQASASHLPFALHVLDVQFPPDLACAGLARRMAMERAVELAGANGVVLTTDADGRAQPGWLAANLAALRAGAEVVAGRADIEPVGAALIPRHLHEIDARECAYAALIDEIHALVDPDPADPWPRHDEHSGASIAVTTAAYKRAGGMPAAPLGEDRAFFAALRCVDARIRHEPAARVTVSARLQGRAAGGMADTIRRRMQAMDAFIDDRLEPACDAWRRAQLRAQLRVLWRDRGCGPPRLTQMLGVSVRDALRAPYFGQAWAQIERRSALLQKHRVPLGDLASQTAQAEVLLAPLRNPVTARAPADPAGIPLQFAAE